MDRTLPQCAALAELDFDALVQAEQLPLVRLASRLTWDAEEARDLVQAALTDAYARRSELRDPSRAAPWLRKILVRRTLNHLRRKRRWAALRTLLDLESDFAAPPEDALLRSQHLTQIKQAVTLLPAGQATAFTLRYLEGLSLDECGDAMGIDRGTVRVHLYRALCKLRAQGVLPDAEEKP
ncbi:MAG: sigma-70 family RNA polymerase sigma factor [Myxococcaceae bacterium]|nr:sigma-70 family RNA polymerase sigma factor [Myxococcaceae bacterium]